MGDAKQTAARYRQNQSGTPFVLKEDDALQGIKNTNARPVIAGGDRFKGSRTMQRQNEQSKRQWRITPRREPITRPTFGLMLIEFALILFVTLAYFLTRGLIRGRESDAVEHANKLLTIERALHLDPEQAIQHFTLHHEWLVQFANNFYLYAHLPVLIAVAIWLYWWRPWAYPWFRNAFLISALFGLSIYVILPVAPPRFMPGFVDTMALYGFNVDGSAAGPLYNPYAAMPSLHVGWSLLAGIALIACARSWWLKAAGIALPTLMTFAVIMTGNHYLLDIVAGAVVILVSLSLSALWTSWHTARAQTSRFPAWIPSALFWRR
jgi:membrane-associated phospholipid phosphatase